MNSSDMLACGEDLGMVPACVAPVLNELGLLGLRIQRMPSAPGQEFGIPADYEYMTVCAPSCHDCSTMRAWWEEDEGRRSRYFRNVLGFSEPPPANCDPRVSYTILQQHLDSPSVWAIFPFQDFLALREEYTSRPAKEETINNPTNPKHYWRFRLHVTLENILHDYDLLSTIREMNVSSGRATLSDLPELSMEEDEAFSQLEEVHEQQTTSNQTFHFDKFHDPETVPSSNGELADKFIRSNHLITA